VSDYRAAYRLNPDHEDLVGLMLGAQMQASDWRDFDTLVSKLHQGIRSGKSLANPFTLLALPGNPADQLAGARASGRRDSPVLPPLAAGVRYGHGRIRIGYVSGDYRMHPLSLLLAGVFEHHDRSRFEIYGISYAPDDGSPLRRRIASGFDHFVDVTGRSD